MENLETGAPRSKERKDGRHNSESTYENGELINSFFFEDPATFFILHLVFVADVLRISELKSHFSRAPELFPVVDSVLGRMEEANMVRIEGDTITPLQALVDFGSDAEALLQFMPMVFRLAVGRVLKNEIASPERRKAKREMVRWFALGDSPAVAAEAKAIDLEYKAKMIALQEKAKRGELGPVSGVRFAGIVDCVLDAEDFS